VTWDLVGRLVAAWVIFALLVVVLFHLLKR
jgi:hypothetical protein